MSATDQEMEAKFAVRDLAALETRLQTLGARRTAERVFEVNLRFDTQDGWLASRRQVLRLRKDTAAVLTFKGPARSGEAVSVRQEIEVEVSDFAAARRLLEALDFRVAVIYEKYRTTYVLDRTEVVLDELPYGSFVEIEGPDTESIQGSADRLGLDWEARSAASYLALFTNLVSSRGIPARNLTFAELAGVAVTPNDLGLRYAG